MEPEKTFHLKKKPFSSIRLSPPREKHGKRLQKETSPPSLFRKLSRSAWNIRELSSLHHLVHPETARRSRLPAGSGMLMDFL